MPSSKAIRVIAAIEAFKGLVVLAAASGLLALLHHDLHRLAGALIAHAHLNPASQYPKIFLDAAAGVTDLRLWQAAAGATAYAVLRLVEAYGLFKQRAWAEVLAATSGAVYVPFGDGTRQQAWPVGSTAAGPQSRGGGRDGACPPVPASPGLRGLPGPRRRSGLRSSALITVTDRVGGRKTAQIFRTPSSRCRLRGPFRCHATPQPRPAAPEDRGVQDHGSGSSSLNACACGGAGSRLLFCGHVASTSFAESSCIDCSSPPSSCPR